MIPEPRWLLPSVVLTIQRDLIVLHGGASGIRDAGLESEPALFSWLKRNSEVVERGR